MNLTHTNEPAPAATVPQEPIDIDAAMAKLILLRREHGLPRPTDYNAYYGGENNPTHTINVKVASGGGVAKWADALGIPATRRRSSVHDGREWHNAWDSDWQGWFVTIQAVVQEPEIPPADLDAVTVAGLEEIAAPAEPARIPAERVNEILTELNRLCGVQAEADRTAKESDGYVGVLDWWDWIHSVPEYDAEATAASNEPGTLHFSDGTVFVWERQSKEWTAALETARKINAVDVASVEAAVEPVVSEVAREILNVLNGDRVGPNPAEAVDWAMRQPEVAGADGPNAEGEYQVEVLDGSVIQWIPAENRWVVTVSDDESTDSPVGQLSGEVDR